MLYINGRELNIERFGTGEVKIAKKMIKDALEYQLWYSKYDEWKDKIPVVTLTLWHEDNEDENDLFVLHMIKRYLDNQLKNMYMTNYLIHLNITVMPYARMDRSNDDYLFTAKYAGDFLNQMKFARVNILEPHSDVTLGNIDSAYKVSVIEELFDSCRWENSLTDDNTLVLFPDAGAQGRYMRRINSKYSLVGFKARDFATRDIVHYHLSESTTIPSDIKNLIVVDDIVATGGTILRLLEELKGYDIQNVYILSTHCENTVYKGKLLHDDRVKAIYTTNSMRMKIDNDKLKVYNLNPLTLQIGSQNKDNLELLFK